MTKEEQKAVLDELTELTLQIERAKDVLIARIDRIYGRLYEAAQPDH